MPSTLQNREKANMQRLIREYNLSPNSNVEHARMLDDFHKNYIGQLKPPEKPQTFEDLERCWRDYRGYDTAGWNK